MEVTRRYRVNVSTTAKGQHTYDCTVELSATGDHVERTDAGAKNLRDAILEESNALVAELDKKYPSPKE